MATVTGFTAERMEEMEAATIVDGDIVGDNLILKRHDDATIDAGNVRGPTGSPGVTQPQLDTFMRDHLPIGSSVDYIGTVSPSTKWLLAIGQTVVNGQTLYPDFWAIIPAGMKSGSSILMPDMRGRVIVAYDAAQTEFDAIGEIGGAKTHTLTQAQLPVATVAIDPPSFNVSVDPPSTSFSVDPPATDVTVKGGQPNAGNPAGIYGVGSGLGTGICDSSAGWKFDNTLMLEVNVPSFTSSVNIAPFNVAVDGPSFPSGNLGSGAAHNILQPYFVMQKLIKVL